MIPAQGQLEAADTIATRPANAPHGDGGSAAPFGDHPAVWLALGAVFLHLAIFLGRGDYVAFDEAWYAILGRNLWTGHGFTMSGLRHVALSPLFPLVAGALGRLLGSPVWGGRVVAAIASGLLVLPCWSIARRLTGRRTAVLTCALVAVLPSLAPFVAPSFVGWDLWVGAGPLYLLFLFSGIALALAAVEGARGWRWLLAGAAFGLAYLDRPEAVAVFGLFGLGLLAISARQRSRRIFAGAVVAALGFGLVTAPYLLYLHDALGRWALTGRGVALNASAVKHTLSSGETGGAATLESMLWEGNAAAYAGQLYRLDPSDSHMADTYWGVRPRAAAAHGAHAPTASADASAGPHDTDSPATGAPAAATAALKPATAAPAAATAALKPATAAPKPATTLKPATGRDPAPAEGPTATRRLGFYVRALAMVVPFFVWPFVLIGLLAPRRRRGHELLAFVPVAGTALLVAALVAIDPRTQLLLVVPLTLYAARGVRLVAALADRRWAGARLRRGLTASVLGAAVVLVLLGMDLRRMWLGISDLSTRALVATASRQVGGAVSQVVPPGDRVMSWNPTVAAWADRDWLPLPNATLPRVLRYAAANRAGTIVFSTLNPSPLDRSLMPRAFVVARVAPGAVAAERWRLNILRSEGQYSVGELLPVAAAAKPGEAP